jgi:hypothetical protein
MPQRNPGHGAFMAYHGAARGREIFLAEGIMADGDDTPVDMYEFRSGGKTYMVTEDEFEKARDEMFKRIKPYADTLAKSMKVNEKIYQGYIDTAELRNGYIKAASLLVATRFNSIRLPDKALATRASAAVGRLQGVIGSKRITDLGSALTEAEEAINAFREATEKFLADLGASAYATGVALTVTTSVGFAVVGVMAGSILVAGGATAGTAAALSAAGVKALTTATELFAKDALGQEDITLEEAANKVTIDAVVAGVTGGVMSKIPTDLFKPMATTAAAKIASKLTYVSSKEMQGLVIRYLEGTGTSVVQQAATEAVDTITRMVQSKKTPTTKDLTDSFERVLLAALTGGFLKNLESAEKKAVYAIKDKLEVKIVPDMIAKLVSGTAPGRTEQVKIVADVLKAAQDEASKTGLKGALDVARGDESADQIAAEAVRVVERDSAVKRLLEAEVKAQLKKRKIAVK